jgi:hypothetical protein
MNKRYFIAGFCLLISLLFLAVATKSSPLYPFNDWVDANSIFTVGKSMMNGQVLYKDIFEQKGPLLYLIHGIGSLISESTFFGMYLLEAIAFAVFLFYCHKIFLLYISDRMSLLGLVLLGFVILFMTNFTHGDSAEEYCLPLLAISMYYLLAHSLKGTIHQIPYKIILIIGFFAGCVVWIKYSMIGFWFGWMAFVFFCSVLKKEYRYSIVASLVFLGGMVLSALPWLLYFGYHDAMDAFIDSYFLINIKYYKNEQTLFYQLFETARHLRWYFLDNPLFAFFAITGPISVFFTRQIAVNWYQRIAIILPFTFLILSTYYPGKFFIYYFFIFSPYAIFGIIAVLKLAEKHGRQVLDKVSFKWLIPFTLIALFLVLLKFHHNVYLMKVERDELFQYQFAKIIKQQDNPTLLNYGFLDFGVYMAADVEPNVRFFQKHHFLYNIYPVDVDEQNRYISEKLIDFIVVRVDSFYLRHKDFLENDYKLVKKQDQVFEENNYTYLLYQKKE